MVDVRHKIKCIEENCLKNPNFNFDSETKKKKKYCVQHKKQNMVNVKTESTNFVMIFQ